MCQKFVVGVLVMLTCVLIENVHGIQCYQCYLAEHPYYIDDSIKVRTCNDFDYSSSFLVDCPTSTFCYKKTVKGYFYKTEKTQVERGCAKQLYKGQNYDQNGDRWIEENYVVEDAYEEGCKLVDSFGLRSLSSEECYCDSSYCNSSPSCHEGLLINAIVLVMLSFVML